MDDLKNQAAVSNAELEGGDRVYVIPTVRTPLNIEADDEGVETAAVDAFDVVDPEVDVGCFGCD